MSYLSSNQLKQYKKNGFVAPINIFTKEKANEIAERVVNREKNRRICQNTSCAHPDSKHIRNLEQCLVFECNCKNFVKI